MASRSDPEAVPQQQDMDGAQQPEKVGPSSDAAPIQLAQHVSHEQMSALEDSYYGSPLRVPGEVIAKEQNNTSRQISFVGKLLSQRNSLAHSRKYPILGTHREQVVKDTFVQQLNAEAHQGALLKARVGGGAPQNSDIFQAITPHQMSAGTLLPGSPAIFREQKQMQGVAGQPGAIKYLAAHRRGQSLGGVTTVRSHAQPSQPFDPALQVNSGMSAAPYYAGYYPEHANTLTLQALSNTNQIPVGQQQVLHPPSKEESFQQLVASIQGQRQQLQRLREQQAASSGQPMHPDDPAGANRVLGNNYQQSAEAKVMLEQGTVVSSGLQNNVKDQSTMEMAPGAAAASIASGGQVATSMGMNTTRMVGIGYRNQGVGESSRQTPLLPQVKYAGDKSQKEVLEKMLDKEYVDLHSPLGRGGADPEADHRTQNDETVLMKDHVHKEYLSPQNHGPDQIGLKPTQRTQSIFNLNQMLGSGAQPGTAQGDKKQIQPENLESWTAKSSAGEQPRNALMGRHGLSGMLNLPDQDPGQSGYSQGPFAGRDLSQHTQLMPEHMRMPATSIGSYYSSSRINLHTQSMPLQSKGIESAGNALKIRLEKQEIDKLLRKVRERKQISLVPDPNVRLDRFSNHFHSRNMSAHFLTPSMKPMALNSMSLMNSISPNPIRITGIKKRQKESMLSPLQTLDHRRVGGGLPADETQLSRTLDATGSRQQLEMRDKPSKFESSQRLGMGAQNQQIPMEVSLAGDMANAQFHSAHQLAEAAGKVLEVDQEHAPPHTFVGRSESFQFQFGAQQVAAAGQAPEFTLESKKRTWNLHEQLHHEQFQSQQPEASSTAAGMSLQVADQAPSAGALNYDFNQQSAAHLQSPKLDSVVGGGHAVPLAHQASKHSILLDQQSQRGGKRMSLPKIKQVFVSPKLKIGGLSARRLGSLHSQKQMPTLKDNRFKTKMESGIHYASERKQSLQPYQVQSLQQLPEESLEEYLTQSQANPNMQSIPSLQVSWQDQVRGVQSADLRRKQSAFTGGFPGSNTSLMMPSASLKSDNFYMAIEQLPHLPLKMKLQAKDLMRHLEKQIRLQKAKIENQRKENESAKEEFQRQFETKKKLKRAARDIVVYQKKLEQEAEQRRKEEVGYDPDEDDKRQLQQEMEELELQIQGNEEKLANQTQEGAAASVERQEDHQSRTIQGNINDESREMKQGLEMNQPSIGHLLLDSPGSLIKEETGTPANAAEHLERQSDRFRSTPHGQDQNLRPTLQQAQPSQQPGKAAVPSEAKPSLMDSLEADKQMTQNGTLLPAHALQSMAANSSTPVKPLQMQSAEQAPILHREQEQDVQGARDVHTQGDYKPVNKVLGEFANEKLLNASEQRMQVDPADLQMPKMVRSEEEQQVLETYAQTEARIYKLYRDYTQNDLKREKKNSLVALKKVKIEGQQVQDELQALKAMGEHLRKTIKRYQSLVENFEEEHENLEKFLVEKREESTVKKKKEQWQVTKQKINKEQRGPFDWQGTVSPQLAKQRGVDAKGGDFLSLGDMAVAPTVPASREGELSAEAVDGAVRLNQRLQGTAKLVKPLKAQPGKHNHSMLLGAAISMPSERPDGTTVSLGSLSARGDLEKIKVKAVEKLFNAFKLAQKSEKPLDVALQVIDLLKASLGCTKLTLYPVDFYTNNLLTTGISKEKRHYLHQVTYVDESDNMQSQITAICRRPEELCEKILFKSLKSLHSDIMMTGGGTQFAVMIRRSAATSAAASSAKVPGSPAKSPSKSKDASQDVTNEDQHSQVDSLNQRQIVTPPEIIDKQEPAFVIQGEVPEPIEEPPKRGAPRASSENKQPIKLNYTTLMCLQLLCMNVQLKLERMQMTQALRAKGPSSEVNDLIQMVHRIYKHKNLKSLMAGLFKEISTFFNFKDICIMFHDDEKDQLYTITYGDQEDKEIELQQKRKTATSEKEVALLDAVEAMKELTLAANQMIYFPVSVGISSMVFREQKAMYFNNFNRVNNIYFVNEIDNVKSLEKIDNLLVGHTTRDDGTSNGIIQLYNHGMPITEMHRKKLEAISRFFGACIQNIEDKTKKITATLAVQLDPGDSAQWLKSSMAAVKDTALEYSDLMKPIERMRDQVDANTAENAEIISGTIPEKRLRELLDENDIPEAHDL